MSKKRLYNLLILIGIEFQWFLRNCLHFIIVYPVRYTHITLIKPLDISFLSKKGVLETGDFCKEVQRFSFRLPLLLYVLTCSFLMFFLSLINVPFLPSYTSCFSSVKFFCFDSLEIVLTTSLYLSNYYNHYLFPCIKGYLSSNI